MRSNVSRTVTDEGALQMPGCAYSNKIPLAKLDKSADKIMGNHAIL